MRRDNIRQASDSPLSGKSGTLGKEGLIGRFVARSKQKTVSKKTLEEKPGHKMFQEVGKEGPF